MRIRRGAAAATVLAVLAVVWAWVGTASARAESLRMKCTWGDIPAPGRLRFFQDPVRMGPHAYRMTLADVSRGAEWDVSDGASAWAIDWMDPLVRFEWIGQGLGFAAYRWRLGGSGWKVDAIWAGG